MKDYIMWLNLHSLPKSKHSKEKVSLKCDKCEKVFERRYDGVFGKDIHHCKSCSCKINGLKKKGIKRSPEIMKKVIESRTKTHLLKCPNFTITCGYCNKDFVVPYRHRDRIYCNRTCQSKAIKRSDIRKTSQCAICKKEFKHYGAKIFCGRECNAKHLSIVRVGENNPYFKKEKEKNICLFCDKEFEYGRGGLHTGQKRIFCSLSCFHNFDFKKKKDSLSNYKDPYPFGWNNALKLKIRTRDNFSCLLCGKKEGDKKHHIHHIDYDKNNLEEENLATLCLNCHNMTHCGRTFWEIIFAGLMSGSKIIRKPWGCEIHIVNHNEYCLKYLVFFKDKQFSFHYHNLKKELWHCVYGRFECLLDDSYFIFKKGDKIEIEPGISHQLQAIKNSILVEVSTKDFPEDSIRKINGIN